MSGGDWMTEEFRRAEARFSQLPSYYRPVVTRPYVSNRSANADHRSKHLPRCPVFWSSRSDVGCTCSDEDRRLPLPDPDRL